MSSASLRTLLALAMFAPGSARAGDGKAQPGAIAPSIVEVSVTASGPDFLAPWQRSSPESVLGSGVVIEGRRILTNAHVVADRVHVEVRRGGIGRRTTAQVEHVCDPCDLALLAVPDERFFDGARPLPIGELPRPQQTVRAYGFPEGGEGLSVTEGVVSRIQFDYYAHSVSKMLMVQVDAAINAGNSGGPVVSGEELIGVSMQTVEGGENIGHIVPAPVIRHFLADIQDGRFDGFPELGVHVQNLENAALRRSLGLAEESGGVLVTAVSRRGSAHGVLRPGDVILAIDGVPVLADNTVALENAVHVESTAVEHRAQVGERLSVALQRDGEKLSRTVTMRAPRPSVPLGDFDRSPRYRIFGGLVFQPLSVRYLDWFEKVPDHLWQHWIDPSLGDYELLGTTREPDPRREVVVLTGLLAGELTRGYEEFEDEVVHEIDGERVRDLGHLSQLLDGATGQFVRIGMERGGVVVLDLEEARARTPGVLARYRVAADRSPELAVPAASRE